VEEVGCRGVMKIPGVVGRDAVRDGCSGFDCIVGIVEGDVGADEVFFFPRTRLSKSRVVSSIGPNVDVS